MNSCKGSFFTVCIKSYIIAEAVSFIMNKDVRISMLFDIYGGLLSEVQYNTMDLYYNQDWSLSEIAVHLKKTRQGVHDSIKRAEFFMNNLENSLNLLEKSDNIKSVVEGIKNIAREKNIEQILKLADKIVL